MFLFMHVVAFPLLMEVVEGWGVVVGMFGLLGLCNAVAMISLVLVAKWTLIGSYRPTRKALYSTWVVRSQLLTSLHRRLTGSYSLEPLRGTPFLSLVLRLYGATVGCGVLLDTYNLAEFDCVRIDDYAVLNGGVTIQTHMYEDRVLKVGVVHVERAVCIGSMSTVLYDVCIGACARIGPLSIVMRGEGIPPSSEWLGCPTMNWIV